MDPVTAGVLSKGLTLGAGSASAGPAGPSNAMGGSAGGGMFDGSGWNVNFGAGGIESSKAGELSQYMPYIIVAVVGLLAWRALKR